MAVHSRRPARRGALAALLLPLAPAAAATNVPDGRAIAPRSWLASVRPSPDLSSADAIELQLLAMQGGNVDAGADLWVRFACASMRLPGVSPWSARALARAVRDPSSQYALLTDVRLTVDFPTEPVEELGVDDRPKSCWHEVELVLRVDSMDAEGFTAAKLGWACEWDAACGWRTQSITWHDFRPAFRPGIGQEEWPRACG